MQSSPEVHIIRTPIWSGNRSVWNNVRLVAMAEAVPAASLSRFAEYTLFYEDTRGHLRTRSASALAAIDLKGAGS